MENKKNILSQITPGNIMTIAMVIIGAVTAWAKIQVHLQDDAIHVEEHEVVLTIDEYKNLLNFATTVNNEFPTIDKNKNRIIELEKGDAVHFSEYRSIYNEHEGLEDKVSRMQKDFNNSIMKIHDEIKELHD